MADYTPTLGDFTELKPFRFWCQKVLPLVYDDSLSYYELLCKVVDYLNKTMEDVETMHDDVVNLHSAYVQLQDYVNTYFDNLDVQEEINNKLDEMAQDGSLSALISPFIPDIVTAWLAEHITPTSPAIDNTLTVSGAGADAKKTGDNFASQYDYTATYNVGDYTLYQGNVYRCVSKIAVAEQWNANHWTRITTSSESLLTKLSIANRFDENTVYTAGSFVISPVDGRLNRITAYHASGVPWSQTSAMVVSVGFELEYLINYSLCPKYDATQTYSIGDYCSYNNLIWECITNITTPEQFTESKWHNISTFNTINSALKIIAEPFSTNKTYKAGDYCVYYTRLFKCHTPINTAGVWSGSSNWYQVNVSELLSDTNIYTNTLITERNINNILLQTNVGTSTLGGAEEWGFYVKSDAAMLGFKPEFSTTAQGTYTARRYRTSDNSNVSDGKTVVLVSSTIYNAGDYAYFENVTRKDFISITPNDDLILAYTNDSTKNSYKNSKLAYISGGTLGGVTAFDNNNVNISGMFKIFQNRLFGKKLSIIGDSLTEINNTAKTNYTKYLEILTGCVVQNLGASGTGFVKYYENMTSYHGRISSIDSDTDIIGIEGSFNDVALNIDFPVGTANDTDATTAGGRINIFFDSLLTAFPNTPIVCYTLSAWANDADQENYWTNTYYRNKVDSYISVLEEICKRRCIPFSNITNSCNLKPWLSAQIPEYYTENGVSNYIHPNSKGHKLLYEKVKPLFENSIMF